MTEYNIKTKTCEKCRVYPNSPNGLQPSVTSITGCLMKYALVDWAANCAVDYIEDWHTKYLSATSTATPDDDIPNLVDVMAEARTAHKNIASDAADFGTWAHTICQKWLEKDLDGLSVALGEAQKALGDEFDKCTALFRSFSEWAQKNKIEPVHTEIVLHGDGYSGRCDLIAYRTDPKTGKRVLGLYDIKTGKGSYYPDWGLQLAAYAEAFQEGLIAQTERLNPGIILSADSKAVMRCIQEIGIVKLNKETLKCNFSEDRGPKFTDHRARLTTSFMALKDFFWAYNDLKTQFEEINAQTNQRKEAVA